jgi:hypothetical protein
VHLTELESRRLHLAAGYGSVFSYCVEELRLSRDAAYHIMKAIRPTRRFPSILDMLLEGGLSVSTVRLMAPYLKRCKYERGLELLEEAAGKSRFEVKQILARIAPKPDTPTGIRWVPTPSAAPAVAPATCAPAPLPSASGGLSTSTAPTESAPSAPAPPALPPELPLSRLEPLSPGHYEVFFTVDEEMKDHIDMALDMLSHALRGVEDQRKEVFRRALKALARELARDRFPGTGPERKIRGRAADAREPSVKVAREVWVRDGGRCRFVAREGRRCTERRFIQFHHSKKPYAAGGEAAAENLELRCAAHNRYDAELYYGRDKIQRAIGVVSEGRAGYRVSRLPQLAPGPFVATSSRLRVT